MQMLFKNLCVNVGNSLVSLATLVKVKFMNIHKVTGGGVGAFFKILYFYWEKDGLGI